MAVIQWWVGAVVLAVAVLVTVIAWWAARPRRDDGDPVLAANLDRVRRLPLFGVLARQERNRSRIEALLLAVAVAGTALMGSRLVGVGDDAQEFRTREVVLCLDVSGSMSRLDADVIDTYLELVSRLEDERIGFVMFDAYAVTVFPLTRDKEYVGEQLLAAKKTIDQPGDVPGTTALNVGSSLIGDGLATCVQHFDQPETVRSRTVVLATDNELAGDAIYSTRQAAELARDAGIMVFGVVPKSSNPRPTDELREAVEPTAGEVITIAPGEQTNVARISSAIAAQQKYAIRALAQDRTFDRIWPGAVLLLIGLAGSLAAAWRRP